MILKGEGSRFTFIAMTTARALAPGARWMGFSVSPNFRNEIDVEADFSA